MANNTNTNPNVLDTFSADVNIGGTLGIPITVTSITFVSAAAGDDLIFIDKNSVQVVHLAQNINGGSVSWTPAEPFTFQSGLTFDADSVGLGSGDKVMIYLK